MAPYGVCRAVRPLYERGVSQSRRPPRRRARASPRGRGRRPRPSRAKPPGTRQPAPATTATAGEPGRRRSAAGASGRIAQCLPPGGRRSGRPIKRTLRDRRAALEFLTRAMKRYGRPASIVTDRRPSYRAAMKVIGHEGGQETRRWLNNRAENSHQPFRRREGAMARFRDSKTLQTFTSVHASIHNHFNHQRHLNRRDIFKQGRAAALAEWRQLAV